MVPMNDSAERAFTTSETVRLLSGHVTLTCRIRQTISQVETLKRQCRAKIERITDPVTAEHRVERKSPHGEETITAPRS